VARRMLMRLVILFGVLAACRGYEPELVRTYHVTATGEAAEGDVESSALLPGESYRVERYALRDFQCLREDGTDPRALPEGAVQPGAPAIFDVLYPAELTPDSALVFMPHGNSFEFIEDVFSTALRKLGVQEDVRAYYALFGGNPEQTTLTGAEFLIGEQVKHASAVAMARRGAAVVVPANCWGDGSYGQGEVRRAFMLGERVGGAFDRRTWEYARRTLTHAKNKEIAVACSGGGRRTIELMQRDDAAFRAVVLDSPADDVTAFLDEPRGDLLALAGVLALSEEEMKQIFERFWKGIYGSKESAYKRSLADEVAAGQVKVPVYLVYSPIDPVVTAPVTARLVSALTNANSPQFSVHAVDQRVHCQLADASVIDPMLAWLGEKVGF
jgi:hypothetical protein